jgi:KTSC domain
MSGLNTPFKGFAMTRSSARWLLSLCEAMAVVALPAMARDVEVKYRGGVNVDQFACSPIDRSSFINGVCFHAPTGDLLIQLNATWYHYCGLDPATFDGLMTAPSRAGSTTPMSRAGSTAVSMVYRKPTRVRTRCGFIARTSRWQRGRRRIGRPWGICRSGWQLCASP